MPAWNLHLDGAADGRANMAKDAVLLRRAAEQGTASLRLYGWDRLTLSVGHAQKVEREVDLAACARRGIPVVRRPTGGRAVLHGTDITYAVAAPLGGARFQGGILGVYREIAQAFLRFFEELGLGPDVQAYSGRERAQTASPVCFVTPSAFEILLRGRKVVGSAQRQTPRAFLQHGSIPLEPQHALLAEIFRGATPEAIAARMTDLRTEGCAPRLSVEALRGGIVRAFGAALDIAFTPAPWSAGDESEMAGLREDYPWIGEEPAPPAGGARA